MIDVRRFGTLGGANHGWLNARHHFSFANYYDPSRMGWGRLRVWNEKLPEASRDVVLEAGGKRRIEIPLEVANR